MTEGSDRPFESRWAISQWFFLNGFVTASWVAHIPRQKLALDASPGSLGLALLCTALGSVVGMAIAPWSIGRFGAGRAAWAAGVTYSFLLLLPLFAWSLPALGLALLAFGIAHGLMDVCMNAAAVTSEKALGRPIMAAFHGWFSVGMVAGVGLAVLLLWLRLGTAGHVTAVIGLALGLLLTGQPQWRTVARSERGGESGGTVLDRLTVVLAGLSFVCLFLEGAMADWAGLLAVDFGADSTTAPLAYAAFTAAWAGGRFLGDPLTARVGDRAIVVSGGVLTALGILVGLWGHQPAWVTAGSAVVGLGLANIVPILFREAGSDAHGRRLALVTGIGYFGFLVGPPLVGFTANAVGLPRAILLVAAGGLLLAAGATALQPRAVSAGGPDVEDGRPDGNGDEIHRPVESITRVTGDGR